VRVVLGLSELVEVGKTEVCSEKLGRQFGLVVAILLALEETSAVEQPH